MSQPTLLDVAKLSGNLDTIDLIEENVKFTPEMEVFFTAEPIAGTSYTTGLRVGIPVVGFRNANEGSPVVKSTYKKSLVECFIIDAPIRADRKVADVWPRGGAPAYQTNEAMGVTKGMLRGVGSQIWYGRATDGKGFPGAKAFTPIGVTTSYGDDLTVDATGDTAGTASSVYAVVMGEQDAALVPGGGKMPALSEWRLQYVDDAAGNPYEAYCNSIGGWIGLQLGNENCVRRICNLTAQTGKGLTDSLLGTLLETFPSGVMPDFFFMSRRSRRQLQLARTVVLQGQGRTRPNQPNVAPMPTEYENIPIIATDSILNTDAIEAAST